MYKLLVFNLNNASRRKWKKNNNNKTTKNLILIVFLSAKFDQPSIENVDVEPKRLGCLKLKWRMSQQQSWMLHNQLSLEVRLRTADSDQMSDPPVS